MGKNSKKSDQPAAPATTSQPPVQTVQPAMPGQLEALAQQLGAGFGQSAPDMMAYLQQFYKPMQVPDFSKGFVPPSGSAATPAPNNEAALSGGGKRLSAAELFGRRN